MPAETIRTDSLQIWRILCNAASRKLASAHRKNFVYTKAMKAFVGGLVGDRLLPLPERIMKNSICLLLLLLVGTTMALAQNKRTYVPKPANGPMFEPMTVYDPQENAPLEDWRKYQLGDWVNQIKEHFCETQALASLENSAQEAMKRSENLIPRQTKDHPQHPFGLNPAGFTVPFP